MRPRLEGVEVWLDGLQLAVMDRVSGENVEALFKVELVGVQEIVVFVINRLRL